MGAFEHFPYTNFHDLNLNWIIQELQKLTVSVQDFISINAIKYADPIQWDITSQYEKNTVVLDEDGNAYLSAQPVPAGVSLDRTEYWTNIGNFSALWENVKSAIAVPDEGHNTTASAARQPNTLVWVDGKLLEVTSAMNAGDRYNTSEGGNSRLYTMQMLLDALLAETHEREQADAAINKRVTQEQQTRENAIEAVNTGLANEIANRKAAVLEEKDARSSADTAIYDYLRTIAINVVTEMNFDNTGETSNSKKAVFESGKVYLFPNGDYRFTNPVDVPNCTLIGESINSIIHCYGGVWRCSSSKIYNLQIVNHTANIYAIEILGSGALIKNCKVNAELGGNIAVYGSHSVIDCCTIGNSDLGMKYGILNNEININNILSNCIYNGDSAGAALTIDGNSQGTVRPEGLTITNCKFIQTGAETIVKINNTYELLFAFNVVDQTKTWGIDIGLGNHTPDFVKVIGNWFGSFSTEYAFAIHVHKCGRLIVAENFAYMQGSANGYFIYTKRCNHCTIGNNISEKAKQFASLGGAESKYVVSGNLASDNVFGVHIEAGAKAIVSNNFIGTNNKFLEDTVNNNNL